MNREQIIQMAQEAKLAFDFEEYPDIWQTYMYVGREEIEHFAKLVAEHEREACAKLCDSEIEEWGWDANAVDVGRAIRERGDNK